VYFSGKNDADEKTYYGQITSQITDVSNGSEDFALELSTLTAGSSNSRLLVTPTETVFNEQSADLDFRIESDGNTNAFFLEGSSGNTGIGIAPSYKLTVNSGATTETTAAAIGYNGDAGTNLYINTDHGNNLVSLYASGSASKEMRFLSGTLEVMRLGTTGNVGIGGAPLTLSGNAAPGLTVSSNGPFILLQDANNADKVTYISNNTGDLQFGIVGDDGATGKTEHMRIDASGRVGIGIAPSVKLEVNGGSDGSVVFSGRSDGGNGNNQRFNLIAFADGGGSGYGGGLKIQTRSSSNVFSDAVTVSSAGNVGIGTSSPSAPLTVAASSGGNNVRLTGRSSDGYAFLQYGNNADNVINAEIGVSDAKNMQFFSNSIERMRIASDGNVEMRGSANVRISLGTAGGSGANNTSNWIRGNANYLQYNSASSGHTWEISGNERLRIDSSGNFLLGTTSAISLGKTSVLFDGTNQNGFIAKTTRSANGSAFAGFVNSSGTVIGSISQDSSSTVNYISSSDQRLKENIEDADASGSTIDAIQVRKFDWIDGGAHEKYGFIAQELKTVVPNAVSSMGMPDEEDPMLGVDPSKLMALAIKEIQMLRARVAQLENT
jgi:hypothetical protein